MSRYKIAESVEHHRLIKIHSYEDLGIHHPTANAVGMQSHRNDDFEPRRIHKMVDGAFEEVRPLPDGRTLIKKDFILSHDASGPVRVPSPASGYVHYLHDKTATMRVYDRPYGEQGAKLLAQVLHMNPRTFHLNEGERIAYGQPMGVMADTGTPKVVHAHVEAESDRFRKYIQDIDLGVITPDSYPALARTSPDQRVEKPAPQHDHASHDITPGTRSDHVTQHATPIVPQGLSEGDKGMRVEGLQTTLSRLGHHNPDGHPLTKRRAAVWSI